jgi:glutathione S-transferase
LAIMITVYGRRSSSNVQKVLWTLGELNIPFARETVGGGFGGTRDAAYRAMHPMGLVPVIRDGGITMFESNAIVRYLAARYREGTFRPSDSKQLAAAEQWMEWQAVNIWPHVSLIFMNLVRVPEAQRNRAAMEAAEKNLADNLPVADAVLSKQPWFAGDHFTMADIVLGCIMWRYSQLEFKKPDVPHLMGWFETLKQRSAYREWIMVPIGRNPQEWTENEKMLR